MKHVVVLGAGKVGRLVLRMLGGCGDYQVTAVDLSREAADSAILNVHGTEPMPGATAVAADITDEAALEAVLTGKDYVVSCAPFHCNVLIATVAARLDVHYFDLTEDVACTKAVKQLAETTKTAAFMPQCGLAPGFITIAANHLARSFETLDTVKMRVGALPMYPHNRLQYNVTWSTAGLINEYANPCEAIVGGRLVEVPPLEGLERLSVDGREYEAFNTSGGLGTLCETWDGKVRNLDYKSIRYPGHRELMAFLMEDLQFNRDCPALVEIFDRTMPHTKQDVVLIFATVTGTREDGRYGQASYVTKTYNEEIDGEHWGAIQITTAAGICAVLDLHAQGGVLPASGFIRQEDVPFEPFITNRFGQHYA